VPPGYLVDGIDASLRLRLGAGSDPAAVDACFRAVARALGVRAIGVLLAGEGADGALGLTHIREAGGLAAVQDWAETRANSPLADILAISPVDLLLPLAELPARLIAYTRNFAALLASAEDEPLAPEVQPVVSRLMTGLLTHTGYDCAVYKPQIILQNAERRRRVVALDDVAEYAQRVANHAEEAGVLLRDILGCARQFFRKPSQLATLVQTIAPRLFQAKSGADQVRVWVMGCATGEEAYSIAILLLEHMEHLTNPPDLRIFATGMNPDELRQAREGAYFETIAAEVNDERLERYFVPDGRWYRVSQAVRQRMVFAQHNLLRDPPFSKLDLVVCRNVLGALKAEAQAQIAGVLHMSLQPGGHVCVGTTETLDPAYFRPLIPGLSLYHRLPIGSPTWGVPVPQLPQAEAAPAPARRRELEALFSEQAQLYSPPGLLIDKAHNILYYSAGVTPYLHQDVGGATDKIDERIHPELLNFLTVPILAAFEYSESTLTPAVGFWREGVRRYVRLLVKPVDALGRPRMASILFIENVENEAPAAFDGSGPDVTIVQRLQQDLAALHKQLQMTTEEYAAINEEMKVANEELLSMNEELQLKTAELEHSKEELQSVNTQLLAINSENQENIVELRRLWANMQNLIAASDITTLFLEVDLRIRWFTPGVGQLFNIQPGDFGRPVGHITHKLAYADLQRDALEVLHTATARELEISSQAGAWYLVRILPYRTADNQVDGLVITFVDITARKQAEDALRQLNVHLEQRIEERTLELMRSNRELDQFAYVASHDLKAPLRAIANLANWIIEDAQGVLPVSSKGHLDKLLGRALRMEKLLDDLLAYSRVGRRLHKPEWVDTSDLVRGIQQFLVLPVGFTFETDLPVSKLYTERVPLETVLRNLVANAIKHHDRPQEGVVRVTTEDRGDWVMFSVADNGPGIAPRHHERIFQIFQSLKSHDQVEGSGMGLAIVKKTVENQGGTIEVESDIGQGTTFRFTWPKLALDPPER
jgi:two-component system, chemotaxis family, CheB/CheR fusion protein